MKAIPYVSFNGNCEEAIRFYHAVLGGKLDILRFKDLPIDEGILISENWKEMILHGSLTFEGNNCLYFGDSWEETPVDLGTNCTIHLQVNSAEDVYRFVDKLSDGGEVTMPADKTFWNSVYGSLIDQYGIYWGIEYELKPEDDIS
jgi:PhnB protein